MHFKLISIRVAAAVIPLAFIPLYINHLGLSLYASIAYAFILQAYLSLLNFGLSQTLSRLVALEENIKNIFVIMRTYETLYTLIGVFFFFLVLSIFYFTSLYPFEVSDEIKVATALFLLSIWPYSLYYGILVGQEKVEEANKLLLVTSILRFGVGYFGLLLNGVEGLLYGHIIAGIVSMLLMRKRAYREVNVTRVSFNWELIKSNWRYSGAVFWVTILVLILGQIDKQFVAHALSKSDFSFYAVISSISFGIIALSHTMAQTYFTKLVNSAKVEKRASLLKSLLKEFLLIIWIPLIALIIFPTAFLEVYIGREYSLDMVKIFYYMLMIVPFAIANDALQSYNNAINLPKRNVSYLLFQVIFLMSLIYSNGSVLLDVAQSVLLSYVAALVFNILILFSHENKIASLFSVYGLLSLILIVIVSMI
jgi:O-antigen/teichoic acid export membrane protein